MGYYVVTVSESRLRWGGNHETPVQFTAWGDSEPRAKAHSKPSESENRDSGERAKGDAGAVFDLAPKSRPGVGPVSSKRWGDGVRKKAKTNNPAFSFVWVLEFHLESAANQYGRASVFSR